jgi:hypothetical protein
VQADWLHQLFTSPALGDSAGPTDESHKNFPGEFRRGLNAKNISWARRKCPEHERQTLQRLLKGRNTMASATSLGQPATVLSSRSFINTHPQPVRPDSTLYIHRHSTKNANGEEDHVVTGVYVTFKAGHENGLFDAFNVDRTRQKLDPSNPKVAVKSLLIACDTLVIHGELSLPECDVKIYARQLIFKENGAINTSPLEWTLDRAADADPAKRAAANNGAHGRNAGNISVFIDEVTVPSHESRDRFIARGGAGQGGGLGKDGRDGHSMGYFPSRTYRLNDSGIKTTTCHANFNPPAVFVHYEWWWGLNKWTEGRDGAEEWPENGEHALAPGVPGDGGDGGLFTCNQKKLRSWQNSTGGRSPQKPPDVRGGWAGTPVECGHYKLKLWHNWLKENGDVEYAGKQTRKTTPGNSFTAKPAANPTGETPAPQIVDAPFAWVHPLQVESVLSYARDAFLGGQRDEVTAILQKYMKAFAKKLPKSPKGISAWGQDNAAQWTSAQSEIATLLQRLRLQLDYFGNPAGYMPQLSLQGAMRLYDIEAQSALRALLLAKWVTDSHNAAVSASKAFGDAIDSLNEETATVAAEMVDSRDRVREVSSQIDSITGRLKGLKVKLKTLESKLFTQAAQDLNLKAQIKFGIKMAGAMLQVIPVGQPALGTLGSLAGAAADITDDGAADTLGKMGDILKDARDAAKEAKEAADEAESETKADKAKDEATAKKKVLQWGKAADGLGPAISQMGEAVAALQVSQEEIDAELAKLKAQNPEWNEMADEIEDFNQQKASFFEELMDALQSIGDGYSRLAGNAHSVFTLQQQRNATLAKVSPEATLAIVQIGQRARIALIRALYLMVKAYETTIFKPVNVDWQLPAVFEKINELLKPGQGFDAATLVAHAKAVEPIFKSNLEKIKQQLLKDYGFREAKNQELEFGLTTEQTPNELNALNSRGRITLSPLEYGLILPDQQRVSIVKIELDKIEFEANGPALPKSGNAILSLRVASDGTMRVGERLYAVRSDAPIIWSWTYHFSNGKAIPTVPSVASLDLLNMILQTSDTELKQKLANPPAWSDLVLQIQFPQTLRNRPRIARLLFSVSCDYRPAPDEQRVLDIRCAGADAELECLPADLGGRAAGFGRLYRIYVAGARAELKAPVTAGGMNFAGWDVMDGTVSANDNPNLALDVKRNTLINCRYQRKTAMAAVTQPLTEERIQSIVAAEKTTRGKKAVLKVLSSAPSAAPGTTSTTAEPASPRLIRTGASLDDAVIAEVLPGENPTVLEPAGKQAGWAKVLFRGTIGYIQME